MFTLSDDDVHGDVVFVMSVSELEMTCFSSIISLLVLLLFHHFLSFC